MLSLLSLSPGVMSRGSIARRGFSNNGSIGDFTKGLSENFVEHWLDPLLLLFVVGIVFFTVSSIVSNKKNAAVTEKKVPSIEFIRPQAVETVSIPEQLKGIVKRHDKAKETIAQYSMDINLALKYPAFNDPNDKVTSDMLKALGYAKDVYLISETDLNKETIKDYSEAVTDLEQKVKLAEENAQHVQWNRLDSKLQKYFENAENLYRQAFDPGNPDDFRVELMNRLKGVIEKINQHSRRRTVPATITHSLERELRKELTQ